MLAGTASRTVCAYTATLPTAQVAQPIATCAVAYFCRLCPGLRFLSCAVMRVRGVEQGW
jgi:hypothetical protein